MSETRCPCEPNPFIGELTIPSGLPRLPRQRGRFGDYRRSLLATSRFAADGALAAWRADDPADLGLMLIDVWAYLLDIISFYDSEIAQESYLVTTTKTVSSTYLTDLIGYSPRPATASTVTIALRANGPDPVLVPAGTAIRSAGWEQEAPQVFETGKDSWIYPVLNELTVETIRADSWQGPLLLADGGSAPSPGQPIIFRKDGVAHARAARVERVSPRRAADGRQYRHLDMDNVPALLSGADLTAITLFGFAQEIAPTGFTAASNSGQHSSQKRYVTLDTLYPQLRVGDDIIVELAGGVLYARTIKSLKTVYMDAGTHPEPSGEMRIPCTEVKFRKIGAISGNVLRVHTRPYRLASLVNPARLRIDGGDLASFAPLTERMEPFDDKQPAPSGAIFKGKRETAFETPVSFDIDGITGEAAIKADEPSLIADELHMPVSVLANLVTATRGETVRDEELGAADGGKPFQSFDLKKKPLTFLPGEGQTAAAVPVLEVRVNGILWQRVDSFVDAGPLDEVYVLKMAPDGTATVQFGDKAIPSGLVAATYRFGAGSARPPAGLINKLAAPVKGIESIAWSLVPRGGSDADKAASIRENAPASMLSFGRAVSLKDYEALAHQYPGVVRASAGWAFAAGSQRAQVIVWVISDGGPVAGALADHLTGLGDPDLPVMVTEAVALETPVSAELEIDPRYLVAEVEARVIAVLTDARDGFLSPANRPMRQSLFRSQLIRILMDIDGIKSVTSLSIGGSGSAVGVTVPEGHYRLYEPLNITVTS